MGKRRSRYARVRAERPPLAVADERLVKLGGQKAMTLRRAASQAATMRENAATLEALVVLDGREEGLSWDELGQLLGVVPSTLRRRYSS